MSEIIAVAAESTARRGLVVVHRKDGTLIKGYLQDHVAPVSAGSLPPLPDTFQVLNELTESCSTVELIDAKAVFFVRTLEGNGNYEEVKFFSDVIAPDLWIQVRLFDGEALEGRTENSLRLLDEPGFWLRPADGGANNLLVYVPKTSAIAFHVMGVAAARKPKDVSDLFQVAETCTAQ